METPTLENDFVRLEPMSIDHATELARIVSDEMWQWMVAAMPNTVDAAERFIHKRLTYPGRLIFAVHDRATDKFVGSTSFYDLVSEQKRVEIGDTFYKAECWGGYVNPACKLLLLTYAFEELDLQRVALRTDVRNERSAAAIKKLGATYEGTLRHHRIGHDGVTSDTLYFSIIKNEWPEIKEKLKTRLSQD